ncbi:hypothetical protein GCM10010434_068940 [Winogradskya humida]
MPPLTCHSNFRGSPSCEPDSDPQRLRWLILRIADNNRDAFSELFDHCSGRVSSVLRRQVSDRHRIAGILAGTFVEVWWLAGSNMAPGTDVVAWIDEIVQRRVTESQPAALSAAVAAWPGPGSLGAQWAHRVELELAGLLRWRHSPGTEGAGHRHGVPELRALPEHDRTAEHGLRPEAAARRQGGGGATGIRHG